MASFGQTILPGASGGPFRPIDSYTGTVNPSLGNFVLPEGFSIELYRNKYLDAIGVQRLWQRTLEEIRASINHTSAKIIPLDFSNGDTVTFTRSESMKEDDEAILNILSGLGSQDIMVWEGNKTYYYTCTDSTSGYWQNLEQNQLNTIKCEITTSTTEDDVVIVDEAVFTKSTAAYSAGKVKVKDVSSVTMTQKHYLLSYVLTGNSTPEAGSYTPSLSGGAIASMTGSKYHLYFDSTTKTLQTTSDDIKVNISGNAETVTNGVTTTNTLASNKIILGAGTKNVKVSNYTIATTLSDDSTTTIPTSDAIGTYVTNAITDATDDLIAIAEGKTKAYVIYAGENNSEFTKLTASIKISNDVNLVLANSNGTKTVSAGSLKVGEIIYLVDSNYPDRWVGQTSSSGPTLYAIDAKTDFSGYQKESDELTAISNITSGGGLLQRDPTGTWELTDQYRRPIYVNNTQVESLNSSTSNALNLVAGDNIQITAGSYAGGGVPVTITATDTKYNEATSTVLGLVKIGYSTDATNKKYAVALDNGKMYVNVPWTDTTYTAGTGLTLSNKQFSIKTLTTDDIDTILANTTTD